MYRKELHNNYIIQELTTDAFNEFWNKYRNQFFDDHQTVFRPNEHLNENEQKQVAQLRANIGQLYRLNLGLYHGDEFIGWCSGFQESADTYYMCNSVVFPEHRRKGLYTALMKMTVEIVTEMGFQKIFSRHAATNNAVIIPKLKAGFHITNMELSDLFGVLIHLSYYPKSIRTKILDYRAGQIKPDNEIRELLKI